MIESKAEVILNYECFYSPEMDLEKNLVKIHYQKNIIFHNSDFAKMRYLLKALIVAQLKEVINRKHFNVKNDINEDDLNTIMTSDETALNKYKKILDKKQFKKLLQDYIKIVGSFAKTKETTLERLKSIDAKFVKKA